MEEGDESPQGIPAVLREQVEAPAAAQSTDQPVLAVPTAIPEQPTASASSEMQVKVFNPPSTSVSDPSLEPDDAFFEPTVADVQSYHATILARSKRLNEAPLLTSKHRDEERAQREKKKADKWPNTTIRIKFSDGTQIQNVFPSNSPIQPVYAFVRSSLDPTSPAISTPFTLYSPPRTSYPEHPTPKPKPTKAELIASLHKTTIRAPANYGHVKGDIVPSLQGGTGGNETLAELGLVPQSVLLIKWNDEGMNASSFTAPLKPELRAKSVPLPLAGSNVPKPSESSAQRRNDGQSSSESGEKKIPVWLQKGLFKKK